MGKPKKIDGVWDECCQHQWESIEAYREHVSTPLHHFEEFRNYINNMFTRFEEEVIFPLQEQVESSLRKKE